MTKKQILAYLIVGILAGLLVSACAGSTANTLTIKGNATNTKSVTFSQLQTPLTVSIVTNNALERETLTAQLEDVALIRSAEAMATTYGHHCEGGEFAP